MKFNFKLFVVLEVASWITLVFYFIAVELLLLNQLIWDIIGVVAISLVVISHIYLFYAIAHNKKKIDLLKEEYIESLKPSAPLRFCPTDEELVKKHNDLVNENISDEAAKEKQIDNTEEKTLEEEESVLT